MQLVGRGALLKSVHTISKTSADARSSRLQQHKLNRQVTLLGSSVACSHESKEPADIDRLMHKAAAQGNQPVTVWTYDEWLCMNASAGWLTIQACMMLRTLGHQGPYQQISTLVSTYTSSKSVELVTHCPSIPCLCLGHSELAHFGA